MSASELPTPSHELSFSLEIPPRPVREISKEALADVDRTIQRLRDWGVKVPDDSRLHKARDVLRLAADKGILVPKHRGDSLGLRSLELAFDYTAIADTLPTVPLASMRRELRDSLVGNIEPPNTSRGPLQLQSQGIVRAAFVRGGLSPTHPTHSQKKGKSPDLLFENGLSRYAVEAKRPQLSKNVETNFESGREQLASYGLQGGVIIDATDCVRGLQSPNIEVEVRRIALTIYDRVFTTGVGHKPGYSDIIIGGAFARVAWTSEDDDEKSMVNVHTSSVVGIFAQRSGTLPAIRAKWIRKGFQDGMDRLSQTLAEANP